MQRPVPGAVLQNDERKERARGDVIMASLSHGDAFVEIFTVKKRLAQFADISFALKLYTQLFAHRAGATVAAHEV